MKRFNRWRPMLRLARRDAARHKARTVFSIALVMLPIAALVAGVDVLTGGTISRERALASIPDGAQAVLTATAVTRTGEPFQQAPEGATTWIDDLDQIPASETELTAIISSNDTLLQYWNSPQLLATTTLSTPAGEVATAGIGASDITAGSTQSIVTATLTEAGPHATKLLLPALIEGTAPTANGDAVITTALASSLGITIGDHLVLVAPPFNGWYSTDGRIGEAIQNSQKGFTVTGIVNSDKAEAWSLSGWMSTMASHDPQGVDGHWLVVGPDPVTWNQIKQMNLLQAVGVSRNVLTDYPSPDERYSISIDPVMRMNIIVMTTLITVLGALIVAALLTPAFSVAADQQRRTLGLAGATGANSHDLRRMLTSQGLFVAAIGGILGCAVGVPGGIVVLHWMGSDGTLASFPWHIIPIALLIALLFGLVATWIPARSASRMNLVDALRDRPTRRTRKASKHAMRSTWWSHSVARMRPALRLAIRDATLHRNRTVPARVAVGSTVLAASLLAVLIGSSAQNSNDTLGYVVAPGHIAIGPSVPVSDDFDQTVLSDAVAQLPKSLGQTQEFPIYSTYVSRSKTTTGQLNFGVVLPKNRTCADDSYPSYASALLPGTPLTCVPYDQSFNPGFSVPWWTMSNVLVMDADAMRASGLPGAEAAARTLEDGGVVVNNAAMISEDGNVRVAIAADVIPETATNTQKVELSGAFVRGLAPDAVVTPATAEKLGVTHLNFVGEYVAFDHTLTSAETAQVRNILRENSLVSVSTGASSPWSNSNLVVPFFALGALAVLATAISLALARTQWQRDFTTMSSVGAPPSFLRRFGIAQALFITVPSSIVGAIGGIALGAAVVAWNRSTHLDGPWLSTVIGWPVHLALIVSVVAAGIAAAALIVHPPHHLVRRPID